MRLIFSRDRAAQLDLLLRSLDANAPADDDEWTQVIWWAATASHALAYSEFLGIGGPTPPHRFDLDLRRLLAADHPCVTFFCDDDVLYRPVPSLGADVLLARDDILTFSLRLDIRLRHIQAFDVFTHAPEGKPPSAWSSYWDWTDLPPHDHGYPGSIDGHTFRTADVLRMIDGQRIDNPLMLETILAHRCDMLKAERPLMACYPEQALVGVPVNTVADDQRRPHGQRFPQPADELNARFLAGEHIDLDALDFSGVAGCLHEVPFVWRQRVEA